MYELINNVPLKIKEYKGHRVVTFKDIDSVHNRPEGTARKRFNDNRKHFIEGEDYYKVKCSEVRPFFGQTPPNGFNPKADIILITENGYLMLVKSFTDDLAWSVQRQLVNTYFKAQIINNSNAEILEQLRNDLKSYTEEMINIAAEKAASETVKALEPYLKTPELPKQTKNKIKCKSRDYQNGKMASLPQNIRRQVDEMIISGKYSCQKIADFIAQNTGTSISYMTVSRYIKKYFKK